MHNVITQSFVGAFLFLTFMLCPSQLVHATEEYARQTGQTCATCHLDPTGGGELTTAGTTFSATIHTKTESPATSMLAKVFRLLIGYIHFLTAVFWFGTILYVHLVLKPTYAASGLPRGEVKVGILSMIIMAATGAILTSYRINSVDTLLHTRFGILLLMKVSLYLVMVTSAVFVVTVIGPRLKARRKEPKPTAATGDLTLEELAACDGIEGRPAYFAFKGKIYDVTGNRLWKQGIHMGRHNAGFNLTEALELAPHGHDKISAMRQVGVLIAAAGPQKKALHERVFYFMAYMNLSIVLIIILILALWRWW